MERETANNTDLTAVICINYGGRDEIVHATRKLANQVAAGDLKPEEITEANFGASLYTDLPDPDLLIRTSGEERISNFMLWQLAYAEFYFTPALWPDFSEEELDKAIDTYNKRQRRFGN
jgi:undecaprenyl diphosphate synthase